MSLRKQPDRKVKQNGIIKMPENLDNTKRKRKLVMPGVEIKIKMAARKQPDRQVKKKRRLEMSENLDITNISFVTSNHQTKNLFLPQFFPRIFLSLI